MKKICAMLLVFALAFPASAAVYDFGSFCADMPAGWTHKNDSKAVFFENSDGSSFIAVGTRPLKPGRTLKQVASLYCREEKGVNFRRLPGAQEAYGFEDTYRGKSTYVRLTEAQGGKELGYVYIQGNFTNDANVLFNSVAFK